MHNFLNGIEHKLEDLVADFADKTQKFIYKQAVSASIRHT
jgi:hypothetical protein